MKSRAGFRIRTKEKLKKDFLKDSGEKGGPTGSLGKLIFLCCSGCSFPHFSICS